MQDVELTVVPGYRLELEPIVTLRPKHGMPVLVRRRLSSAALKAKRAAPREQTAAL